MRGGLAHVGVIVNVIMAGMSGSDLAMQPLPDASSSAMQRSGYPVGYAASLIAGIATPTEAAVLGVIAVIVVGGFLYRELSVATFARQTLSTLRTVGSVFIIIAAAAARSCPA